MTHHIVRTCFAALLVAAAAVCTPTIANAQRGEKTVGVAAGYATYNNGGYTNIYFQYSFAQHVRIAPQIGYAFRNEGKTGFEFAADVHFPFRVARGLGVYPLLGLTYNNWSFVNAGHASRFGFDAGAGIELYMTPDLKLTLQGKYAALNDTGGGFISLGIGYVF